MVSNRYFPGVVHCMVRHLETDDSYPRVVGSALGFIASALNACSRVVSAPWLWPFPSWFPLGRILCVFSGNAICSGLNAEGVLLQPGVNLTDYFHKNRQFKSFFQISRTIKKGSSLVVINCKVVLLWTT